MKKRMMIKNKGEAGRFAGSRFLCGLLAWPAMASAAVVDFEGLTPGSVNGQAGWSVADEFGNSPTAFDEEVMDDGTGNMVWRVSNAVTTTGFANQPFTHTSPLAAGETGSALWNDRGSDHTAPLSPPNAGALAGSRIFNASFSLKSATGAAQSGLAMSLSPSAKQSAYRNGYLNLVDVGTGIEVRTYDVGISTDPWNTATVATVATLNYTDWHDISMSIEFVDGLGAGDVGNDIMHIYVNGSLVHTGSTWEAYYAGTSVQGLALPTAQAVDSLSFRLAGAQESGNLGNGFFLDNVEVINEPVPEPGSALLAAAGLVIVLRRRSR
ncbi:MAG: hypothetical protein ACQKBY_09285 [Verrucomicrobiales bacterium]